MCTSFFIATVDLHRARVLGMASQLRELLVLMVLAAVGVVCSWTQGDQFFPCIFAAQGLVAAAAALRWV